MLKSLLFGGSWEQGEDLRPLHRGEKTDRPHRQDSSRKQSWEKINKAICGEGFGGVIWLNASRDRKLTTLQPGLGTVSCITDKSLEGISDGVGPKKY